MSLSKNSAVSWKYPNKRTVRFNHLKQLKSQNQHLDTKLIQESRMCDIGMTKNPHRKCREETFPLDSVASWGDAVGLMTDYIQDKRGLKHILQNKEDGSKITIEHNHAFEESYKKKLMAKFYSIEEQAKKEYGEDNLKTVMITLSASPIDDNGNMLPPIDHLDSIMDKDTGSWRSVKSAIHRNLNGYEFEYMRILEPHTDDGQYLSSGYAHQHIALLINDPDDDFESQDFQNVLNSHINNCATAEHSAHKILPDDKQKSSVTCMNFDKDKEGGIGAYLTSYMGQMLDGKFEDNPAWFKRFLATLWLSNRRRVGFSDGANAMNRRNRGIEDDDDDDDAEYEYWGIETEDKDGNTEQKEVKGGHTGSYLEKMPDRGYNNGIEVSFIYDKPPD